MRKYNYGSIILILIANAIIVGILENIFDGNLSILGGFVTFISDYIICRGLLYKRGKFFWIFYGNKNYYRQGLFNELISGSHNCHPTYLCPTYIRSRIFIYAL